MRLELLYNPRKLVERLAIESNNRRRLAILKGSVAEKLTLGHIDSLELLQLLRTYNPRVFYDIGAHIGTWSLLAKALYPDSEIHSFEPLPDHQTRFKQNTSSVSNLHLHPVALGAEQDVLNMQVATRTDSSSLLAPTQVMDKIYKIQKVAEEPVQVEALDEYRLKHSLPYPDLIKLDVQGYEFEVLRGASDCMAHAKAILMEVSFVEFYKGQPLFHELDAFLYANNFQLYALGNGTVIGQPLTQTDMLYLSNKLLAEPGAETSPANL